MKIDYRYIEEDEFLPMWSVIYETEEFIVTSFCPDFLFKKEINIVSGDKEIESINDDVLKVKDHSFEIKFLKPHNYKVGDKIKLDGFIL